MTIRDSNESADTSSISNSLTDHPKMTPYGSRYVAPEGIAATLRAQARDAIRAGAQITAGLRTEPDYLVIGSKRGGTTSMARWLLAHPDVMSLFPARETRKGTYYFDVNYQRGSRWYRSHFPTRFAMERRKKQTGRTTLVGEATPYYLHHPHAAIRARGFAADAKVIALLRDPVDRAHSHWIERTRNGVETLDFPEAIAAESERLAGEEDRMLDDPGYVSFAHQHFSYVDQGRYARGLRRWLEVFPTDQVHVIQSEDLYADPAAIYAETLDFLGLAPHTLDEFSAWNMKSKPTFDPESRRELRQLLAPDVAELEELLGRKMTWPHAGEDNA